MTVQELEKWVASLKVVPMKCSQIIAETAREYFTGRFDDKAYDGRPWRRTKKSTGSTLVESGNLMNSIRPSEISEKQVVISAGNEHVPYARVHNEGGIQYVKPHHRTIHRKGKAIRQQVRGYGYHAWRRQFMGDAKELMTTIEKQINIYLSTLTK